MTLRYELGEWGWATAWIGNGTEEVEMRLSYLADPLRKLAVFACSMLDRENPEWEPYAKTDRVVFLDEPGAHILTTEPSYFAPDEGASGEIEMTLRLRWSPDYSFKTEDEGTPVLTGVTTAREFGQAVLAVLDELLTEHGFSNYRRRWIENDFPLAWHARLAHHLGRTSLQVPL